VRHTLTSCAVLAVLLGRPEYAHGGGVAEITGLPLNTAYKSLYRLERDHLVMPLADHGPHAVSDDLITYKLSQPAGYNMALHLMHQLQVLLEPLNLNSVQISVPGLSYGSLVELAVSAVLLVRTASTAPIIAGFAKLEVMSVKKTLQRFERYGWVKIVGMYQESPIYQLMPDGADPAWISVVTAWFILGIASGANIVQ
jgi:hypothetical protein